MQITLLDTIFFGITLQNIPPHGHPTCIVRLTEIPKISSIYIRDPAEKAAMYFLSNRTRYVPMVGMD